ncbi:MAG: nucleotidyltransferase family protein [Thermoleophilia bacterium]
MRVAGVVLAGGASSRMGRPKQLLQVGGRTLLQRAVDALLEGGVQEVVVVLGADAAEVITGLGAHPGVRTVMNSAHATGQSSSVRAGINALDDGVDAAVMMVSDRPYVTADAVREVVRAAADSPEHEVAIAQYTDGQGHPVLLRRAIWPQLMLLRGDVGARAVLPMAHVLPVPVPDHMPRDVDTPDDLSEVVEG